MRQFERERSHDLGGPVHLSCVLYSAMACPYLREKNSRLGKDSMIGPGARRGTRAAVMGFKNFGLLIFAEQHLFLDPAKPPPSFAFLDLTEDIGYRDGDELADRYEAAVEADTKLIDTSRPRLYWSDNEADTKAIGALLRDDFRKLEAATPAYEQIIVGMGRYVAFPM